MKKITLLLMVALAAINISAATIVIPEEANAWNIPAEAIDVLQAREICAGLEADVPTTENYYVMGYVKRVSSKNAETVSQYGQARFYLENVKEANSEEEFDAYQVHGLNGVKINNPDVVAAGDFVVIYGPLTKHQYEGGDVAYQTPGKGAAYIWNSTNPKLHNDTATTPETPTDETLVIPDEAKDWNIPAEAIDVVKAREICAGLASGATSGTKYYVMGYVKKIHSKHADGVANFGNAQFYMENVQGANSSNDFMAYQVYGPNGQKITDVNSVAVGDFVVVYGELTNYNGTYETVGKGAAYIWNSTNPLLGSTTPSTPPVDPGQTTIEIPAEAQGWNIPAEAIDVLQARAICAGLASGATTGTKYYVMGYVKKIHSKHADGVANFGNAQFYMENVKGANSEEDFLAYQVYGLNGEKITDPNVVAVGDFVVVYGELTNYMGNTYETVGKGAAYIWNSTNSLIQPDPNTVNIKGLQYADAYYYTEDEIGYFDFDMYVDVDPDTYEYTYPELYIAIKANSKTALNGTYDLLYAGLWTSANDSIEMGEELGTVTIKNVDAENNYSFKGSFVGTDGKTYNFDDVMYAWGYDVDTDEDIVFSEESTGPVTPPTPPTGGAIVFDASVDQGDAPIYADGVSGAQYTVTKNNVTLTVSSGVIGTANSLTAYRIYKGSTLTVSSSAGNIKSIVFTCTAENDAKQGPGCFTVDGGDYTYAGTVGTWTGDAATITFTASTNQVRATQIVVTLANATAVEDVTVGATPVKVIENGQVLIIRGEHIYNVLGAQVK